MNLSLLLLLLRDDYGHNNVKPKIAKVKKHSPADPHCFFGQMSVSSIFFYGLMWNTDSWMHAALVKPNIHFLFSSKLFILPKKFTNSDFKSHISSYFSRAVPYSVRACFYSFRVLWPTRQSSIGRRQGGTKEGGGQAERKALHPKQPPLCGCRDTQDYDHVNADVLSVDGITGCGIC